MPVLTDFLKLLKMDGETEGSKTFNIQTMLNDNWDKIEAFCTTVKGHIDDAVSHVTSAERTAWNAKETVSGAQAKANAAKQEAITAAADDATAKANAVKASMPTSLPANGGNANYANTAGNANALGGIPASGFYSASNKEVVTGAYTGDGVVGHTINMGFTPSIVMIWSPSSSAMAYPSIANTNFPNSYNANSSGTYFKIVENGFNVHPNNDYRHLNSSGAAFAFMATK